MSEKKENVSLAEQELEEVSGGGFDTDDRMFICSSCGTIMSAGEYYANNGLCNFCLNRKNP